MEVFSTDLLVKMALAVITGFGIGFLGGMLGLILGIIRLPIIVFLGLPLIVAAGTNLGISAVGAIPGATRHYLDRRVDPLYFLVVGGPAIAGAFVSASYSNLIPNYILTIFIAFILIYSGFMLIYHKYNPSTIRDDSVNHGFSLGILIGLSTGILAGLSGAVMGALRLPAMMGLPRLDTRKAVGTNFAIAPFVGISGLLGHALNQNFDLLVLISMAVPAMIGSYYGSRYTGIIDQAVLRRCIGYVLIGIAAIMFVQVILTLLG